MMIFEKVILANHCQQHATNINQIFYPTYFSSSGMMIILAIFPSEYGVCSVEID